MIEKSRPAKHLDQIAVDVDATLILAGEVNMALVDWIREQVASGRPVLIWSARGESVAKEARDRAGLQKEVPLAISKPKLIVDDKGWSWVKYTRAVHPSAITKPKE